MTTHILRIDASARKTGSVTRDLNDRIIEKFAISGQTNVVTRDLTEALPQITEDWVAANFTAPTERTSEQHAALVQSDTLVAELEAADVILIGLPIYNFGVPTALKAWIDLVARAGKTFRYAETGPVGLLDGKRAVVAVASGGTERGSAIDFATGYLEHVLGFIGITDVEFVSADRLAVDAEASMTKAESAIADLDVAA